MKIKEYRKYFIETLTPIYDAGEAESFFYLLLEHKANLKRIDLALHHDATFSDEDVQNWNVILDKLQQQIPIQYIIGSTNFFGLNFEVNENVLIPRPETEELVEWILSSNRTPEANRPNGAKLIGQSDNPIIEPSNHPKILDIGTGSGCIAIALAKNLPNAAVYAIDVSAPALATAKINSENNHAKVTFIQADILNTDDLNQRFDIIVSNPPYVRHLEKTEIRKNVLDNEPHLALFVDDDNALVFYKKIVQLAIKNLNPKGQLYFEINKYMAKEMMDLLETSGFQSMELRKDIYGNDRMVRGVLSDQ